MGVAWVSVYDTGDEIAVAGEKVSPPSTMAQKIIDAPYLLMGEVREGKQNKSPTPGLHTESVEECCTRISGRPVCEFGFLLLKTITHTNKHTRCWLELASWRKCDAAHGGVRFLRFGDRCLRINRPVGHISTTVSDFDYELMITSVKKTDLHR